MAQHIDYDRIVQKSLLRAVRQILAEAEKKGLSGDQHFYISFRTDRQDVIIPDFLRQRHPYEVTIVLQYQFWELKVAAHSFSVQLSFNNNLETIQVPFSALLSFIDPSVKFGLEFSPSEGPTAPEDDRMLNDDDAAFMTPKGPANPSASVDHSGPTNNVVALDLFRKK